MIRGADEMAELAFTRLPPGRYRMLSLRQPWAWLVVFGGKDIENRSWDTEHRGTILIHAAKQMTRADYRRAHEYALRFGVEVPGSDALDFGGIIGRANLVDMLDPMAVDPTTQARRRWHMAPEETVKNKPQYGWVLRDASPVEFIPCKGALSLQWFEQEAAA